MQELFGIPVGTLAVVLVGLLAVALAAVGVLAVRNRIFLKLGLRNAERRRGRSALIVLGLMLGTAIIAAAFATGDTMSRSVRTAAIAALGDTDEMVSVKGADVMLADDLGQATGMEYFNERAAEIVENELAGSDLVDGVAPAIVEPIAVQNLTARQTEPRVTLFASDPEKLAAGFGEMRTEDGVVTLADLDFGQLYLNEQAADDLKASAGDRLRLFAAGSALAYTVKAVVDYDGTGTSGAAVLLPLVEAQYLLGHPDDIKHVLISNRGDEESGAVHSDAVVDLLEPLLGPVGLEADPVKQDALELADETGAMFVSFFTTFGSFSIAAGILLIFLIFVMLAAERRGELGIARAVGTRRDHLVQMFLFEGVAYDLVSAAVGVFVGAAVAYGMVFVLAASFDTAGTGFDIEYAVEPRSLIVAYALGVMLTFGVVTFSAWRVSRMNIVTAIRNLPEPPSGRAKKRHWVPGTLGLLAGGGLIAAGVSASDAVVLGLGVSLVLLSAVPLLRLAGVSQRVARTASGLLLVAWFLLPTSVYEQLLGDLTLNFSIFILAGLMIVIGATWVITSNADILLGAVTATAGRIQALAPVVRMAVAYPLRNTFRTGVTLAMFTLVVFTLVVGATTSGSFINAFDDVESFGGGFDVRADTSPVSPILNMRAAIDASRALEGAEFDLVASQSFLPVDARQSGTSPRYESYVVRGLDRVFLEHNTFGLAATARGYSSADEVWRALVRKRNLAVVDATVVPRRDNWGFGGLPDFQLSGFYVEDGTFDPIPVEVRDPQTQKIARLTVIGVLKDSAPYAMAGISTSQTSLERAFGNRVRPTVHYFALAEGVDPKATAEKLESTFLTNGVEAEAITDVLDEAVGGSKTFNKLIQGFMGLGLVVGVAALGVITARAVVERRQEIGVLRAIGFRRQMVQLSFLFESSFIALTSIGLGTLLGLIVSFNVIHDAQQQPSYDNVTLDVPWLNLGVIFFVVYGVALLTTIAPAIRASRVYPAEALRYE